MSTPSPGPSDSAAPTASFAPGSLDANLGSAGPLPSGTPWPGNVPDDVIALGALDEQIAAAGQAMDAGITAKDLTAISAAAKGLVDLLDKESGNVSTIQGYPGTRTLGDAYAAAIAKMRSGAQAIVDGVAKGDATAVDAGVKDLSDGSALYGLARKALGPYLEQALSMKKMYLK